MLQKASYVTAIGRELQLRANYLDNESIDTIYFGGGTPSQLSKDDLDYILKAIHTTFKVNTNAEITLEANPDDLNAGYVQMLLDLGFNRLSMGVQSFDDTELNFLNRRHSAARAIEAVTTSKKLGFNNISIDLMYGLPNQTMDAWTENLTKAIDSNIQHISAYHLIYEEGTKLYRLMKKGDVRTADEELSVAMFSTMIDRLSQNGFIHYEISNFGKENHFSRHNSSYWLGVKYLGLGPSAHSFNGINRCWNISSIPKYIQGVEDNKPQIEIENLDTKTQYNDFILTGLRTMWGINTSQIKELFGEKLLNYCISNIQKHILSGDVIAEGTHYKISRQGIFISDTIMSDLMYV